MAKTQEKKRIYLDEDEYNELKKAQFEQKYRLLDIIFTNSRKTINVVFVAFIIYLTLSSMVSKPVDNINAIGNAVVNTIGAIALKLNEANKTVYFLCGIFFIILMICGINRVTVIKKIKTLLANDNHNNK